MLFRSTVIVGLAAVALAAPAQQVTSEFQAWQDMIGMTETFDHIFTGLDGMVVDINAFKGDSAGVDLIVSDASNVERAIKAGAAKMTSSKQMTIPDLLNILGPVTVMESRVGEIIDTLSKQKTSIEKAGGGPKILAALQSEKAAADILVKSIVGNLPLSALVGPIAGPIAATITNQLVRGIKEWGGKA